MFFKQLLPVFVLVSASMAANSTQKRGIYGEGSYGFGFNDFAAPSPYLVQKVLGPTSVSAAEIASAIQAAKEASSAVNAAQRRVQEAKEEVLHQQHVASQKQAQATLALQKAEAAAAVQQQEAKAAANAVVLAQQRLAQAKHEVSELQRHASAKEAHAAAIIQKSAAVAAAEIQRKDEAARKIAAIQHSGTDSLKQVAASKSSSLSAASAAVAASAGHPGGTDYPGFAGGISWAGPGRIVQLHPWG